ncbi:MAG: TonB-dependent receptor [Bacteroidota bacterium]
MKKTLFILLAALTTTAFAQDTPSYATDSTRLLQEVVVQAFSAHRPLNEVAVSVGYLNVSELQRFASTSLLPAINTIPGVRMEERSPGSFRFSIRGSLIRSPFGVRNVKVYWNGLPFTDGGGNTYLNLLDLEAIGNAEIIKGPGGSLYGAGTGGVVLLNSAPVMQKQLAFSMAGGGYDLQRYHLTAQTHTEKVNARIQVAHQASNGYRVQTEMRRDAVNADLGFRLNSKSILSATLLYTDLFYETPGGLTKAQFDEDPRQARPSTSAVKGAVEQQAAVNNKTLFGGLVHEHQWDSQWSTRTGLYMATTQFQNPTIRNYEKRKERNAGLRTESQYSFGEQHYIKGKVTMGAEYQHFYSPLDVYGNNLGSVDTVQTKDELTSSLFFAFVQAELDLPRKFYLTVGGSFNNLRYGFERLEPSPITNQSRKFDGVFSPRISLLKKLTENFSIYASASRGFSPPSLAEVRPSTNTFNPTLKAESGSNLELGFKGTIGPIVFNLAAYNFVLDETIVIQRTSEGADYFVNAGKTSQRGIEAELMWKKQFNKSDFIPSLKLWGSFAYQHYRFRKYVQDNNDFSGNKLTGVAPSVGSWGIDASIKKKGYLNVTCNYVDHIPLNDANTAFASEYVLLGARAGYRTAASNKFPLDVYIGVDNALDKRYSLGNDLNAIGGRYFNAAPGVNFYAGVTMKVNDL